MYISRRHNLCLRFHQELITLKTVDLIKRNYKDFLWGCKCRSGKTYMIGGLLLKLLDLKQILNALIITPAPTETISQFTDGLFSKFVDFDKFKVHNIVGSKQLITMKFNTNNIFIISKQLLQRYVNEKTIVKIRNAKLDVIAFDENHYSGTTDISESIFKSYCTENTVKVYLTATFNKPLHKWPLLRKRKNQILAFKAVSPLIRILIAEFTSRSILLLHLEQQYSSELPTV